MARTTNTLLAKSHDHLRSPVNLFYRIQRILLIIYSKDMARIQDNLQVL